MATVPRLVAMETILENIAEKLVSDVKEGTLPMSQQVMECLEALVDATQKTQIVREMVEIDLATSSKEYRLAS